MPPTADLKAYLESHPLAFEILSILSQERKTSATYVAGRLGRSVSTVYDSLSEMKRKGILRSEKKGVTTYFHPVDMRALRQCLKDPELRVAFAKATARLRREPVFLIRTFKELLEEELRHKIEIERDVRVQTLMGETRVDFLARMPNKKIYIAVTRISAFLKPRIHEALGRTINIISGIEKDEKFLLILLLPPRILRSLDEQTLKLFQLVNKDKFGIIMEHIDTVDLTNESFIQELAERIIEKIKQG